MKFKKQKVVFYILLFVAIGLIVPLAIPLAVGSLSYIININGDNNEGLSATASIGLALLASALGALTLLFVSRTFSPEEEANTLDQRKRNLVIYLGKCFIFAALCFTIFGLLTPFLPIDNTDLSMWDNIVRWAAAISSVAGSVSLVVAVVYSIVFIWIWRL